jgi:putative endonuclease
LSSSSPEGDSRKKWGGYGEDLAAALLRSRGLCIIDRNWRHGRGELDLVCRDADGTVVFVEVKSSRGRWAGDPGEWITPTKQRQVAKVALAWLVRHGATDSNVRFDAVLLRLGQEAEHVVDAFRPEFGGF